MTLRGKVALVTGGGRGLGRAYALRLARLGADVAINDINPDAAREFQEELTAPTVMDEVRAYGGRSIGIQADVTKKERVDAMVERVIRELGRIDILVNNAGGALTPFERGRAPRMPEDDLRFIMDVNLMSTIFCCQAVAPHMTARKSGKIINVSSQAGLRGNEGGDLAHSCAAKAGVAEYTRLLAGELGPHGVNVNAIAPGVVATSRAGVQFGRGVDPVKTAEEEKHIPHRSPGDPRRLRQGGGIPGDGSLGFRHGPDHLCVRRDGPVAVVIRRKRPILANGFRCSEGRSRCVGRRVRKRFRIPSRS